MGLKAAGELLKQLVEPVDGRPFRQAGGIPSMLPVAVAGLLGVATLVIAAEGRVDEGAVACVCHVGRCIEEKLPLGSCPAMRRCLRRRFFPCLVRGGGCGMLDSRHSTGPLVVHPAWEHSQDTQQIPKRFSETRRGTATIRRGASGEREV